LAALKADTNQHCNKEISSRLMSIFDIDVWFLNWKTAVPFILNRNTVDENNRLKDALINICQGMPTPSTGIFDFAKLYSLISDINGLFGDWRIYILNKTTHVSHPEFWDVIDKYSWQLKSHRELFNYFINNIWNSQQDKPEA
jgi:hypothetical protein